MGSEENNISNSLIHASSSHQNSDLAQQTTGGLICAIHRYFLDSFQFERISVKAHLSVQLDGKQDRLFQFEDCISRESINPSSNISTDDKIIQTEEKSVADNSTQTETEKVTASTQTDTIEQKHVSKTESGKKKKSENLNDDGEEDDTYTISQSELDSDDEDRFVVMPTIPPEDNSSTVKSKNESVSCPLCSASFRSQSKVENHLRVHHDIGNVYLCKICEEVCPSNRALHQHMEDIHDLSQEEVTPLPKKRGRKPSVRNVKKLAGGVPLKKTLSQIKASQKKNQSSKPKKKKIPTLRLRMKDDQYVNETYPCEQCKKVYRSSKALRRHDMSVHKKNKFDCNICHKSFCSKESLYHHKRGIHHGQKPYSCEECGQSFNFSHSLKLHVLKHSGKRPHQCPQCDKTYLTANHLKMHMIGVHQNNKMHMCRFCSKSFAYKTSLKVHEMTHENIKPYKCTHCDKGFVNSHSLKYHIESKHEADKWHSCDICQKQFKTEFSMKTHRRRHSLDGNRFMCDICGRQFMYKSTLEIHSAIHKDEKSYQCSTCGKSFKTYATLYSHQYVHKSDSPYPCPECGKQFKTKERCKAHQKRHSGTKSFSCDLCGNLFQDKGGLSKHKRTVHADFKRFACPVCGKTCSRADNLRVHMKIHGKWTQNTEPIDTTTSVDAQTEKATIQAVHNELSRQSKENSQRQEPTHRTEPNQPEHRNTSPQNEHYPPIQATREMSSSPNLTALGGNRAYHHDQQQYTNISPAPNINMPLALTSMANSHMHPAESSDVQSAHGGPVTQMPNPSPFMYMWPYINPHQNMPNPQEHEYYGQ